MDVLEAIRSRRSVGKVRQDPVPRELIEQMLEAAVQAPNHHLTLPWRFWVLSGVAREDLGTVIATALRESEPVPTPPKRSARGGLSASEEARAAFDLARAKPLRAPVVIVAAVRQTPTDPVLSVEDLESGAAAVQNMLLAARALGLGAMWRTGEGAYLASVKAHFGLKPEDHILGFVYVGYPAIEPANMHRDVDGMAAWWGWD